MAKTPAQRITPYLLYEDVAAAADWLTRAFGFKELQRFTGPDGRVNHTAMRFEDGVVMMGAPGGAFRNPKHLGQVTQNLYVNVDNIDAHFARAKKAGATILEEPKDQFYGDRRYGCADPEGHHWYFAQHVRDVSEAEMAAAVRKGRG